MQPALQYDLMRLPVLVKGGAEVTGQKEDRG
jgi:hypothetical protein